MAESLLADLDLFYRDITPSLTQVYARLPWPDETRSWKLAGRVRGPFTSRGHTLPANSPIQDLGVGDFMLAKSTLVDPCTWSPAAPHQYQVTVDLLHKGIVIESARRELGIRDLRPQRTRLILDGKGWVLRGVTDDGFDASLSDWTQATTVRVSKRWDESWLTEASLTGTIVAIDLSARLPIDQGLLSQVARLASVVMVVLPNPVDLPNDVRLIAPNLLLAQCASAALPPAAWAHVAWVDSEQIDRFQNVVESWLLPVIAARPGRFGSLIDARAACDQLQAELAPLGQFAGYVV